MCPNDYHNYVIQNGEFIGDFEGMYRNCDDPWHQDSEQFYRKLAVALVEGLRVERVLDVGCGKGAFTAMFRPFCSGRLVAVDVSLTAVRLARARLPDVQYAAGSAAKLPFKDNSFDLVVCAELMWYVLPYLSEVGTALARLLRPGGHLLIIQHYYQPGEQAYGLEVMTSPEDLISRIPLEEVRRLELDRRREYKYMGLFRKPE